MNRDISPLAITLLLLGSLLLPVSATAQVNAITEIRIPRQHSAEFVELYAEMAEMLDASSEGARPVAKNLLGHSWANDVAFLQIITYESLDDLHADFNTDGAKMRAYRETLSEADREAFQERWARFRGLYLEGHTDEVRVAVQDWGFNYDPAGHEDHAHVVTRSQYWPTYANSNEFLELTAKNLIPEDPADHKAIMVVASRHTAGSGSYVDVWSVYESWADFAEFMTDTSLPVDEADLARAFEIEGKHRDDIFMRVGTLARDADGTGRFVLAGN